MSDRLETFDDARTRYAAGRGCFSLVLTLDEDLEYAVGCRGGFCCIGIRVDDDATTTTLALSSPRSLLIDVIGLSPPE